MQGMQEELADVVIYYLLLTNTTGIDLASAIKNKIHSNVNKYTVERFKGRYK